MTTQSFTNAPLRSVDFVKLGAFALALLLLMSFTIFGIFPIIFIIYGTIKFRKSRDFKYIENAVRYFRKTCIAIAIIALITATIFFISSILDQSPDSTWASYDKERYLVSLIILGYFTGIALLYSFLAKALFLEPLHSHKEWVAAYGVFTTRRVMQESDRKKSVSIIGGEKLKQFSVAGELTKWAKLREEGHVTEDEFNEAKNKLLNRNQ